MEDFADVYAHVQAIYVVNTFYMFSQKESRVKEDESKHHGAANEFISE